MLIKIDDADTALLFASLPCTSNALQPHNDQAAALLRLWQTITAEAQHTNMHWVLIDEDIKMAVASSPSSVLPTSHVAAATISAPPCMALPIATQALRPVMLPPCPVTPASTISRPATPMSPGSPFTARSPFTFTSLHLGEIGNTPHSAKENYVDPEKGCPALTPMRPLTSAAMGSSEVLTTGATDIFGSPLLAPPIRLLSPLRLSSPAAVSLPSSSLTLLSPTSTLVGLASPDKTASASELTPTSALKKSKAAETTLEPLSSRRSKGQAAVAAAAGGDDNDYDGGGSNADLDDDVAEQCCQRPTETRVHSPCPQGGNQTCVGEAAAARATASTISEILQRLEEELDGEGVGERAEGADRGTEPDSQPKTTKASKAKAKAKSANIKGTSPSLFSATSSPIVWLSYITTSPEIQNKLVDLLLALPPPPSVSAKAAAPASAASPAAAPVSSSPDPVTLKALARHCSALENAAVVNDFWQMMSYMDLALHVQWRHKGAAQGMSEFRVLAKECGDKKIDARRLSKWFTAGSQLIYLAAASSMYIIPMFAAAVSCGQLIQTLVVPQMALIKQLSLSLDLTAFQLLIPGPTPLSLPFSTFKDDQAHLRAFKVNFYSLPVQDSIWSILSANLLSPSLAPVLAPLKIDKSCIGEDVKILAALHADRVKKPDTYVCINAKICEGKVLHLCGQDNKLLALVATNLLDMLPHLQMTLLDQLASIMGGELYSDKSD
ncbi:hypothetical protein B0H17DRAFT_1136337 [Mycena rosella]|uniref:Uncharacterized protein n=1 Tax=Mycena rosella TaxID=1033263 RepID=A0AAD7GGU8_MYCRO|nr:hypothetical protein B0H17DRAFT_1136337 [Mycena rosella]